MERCHFCKGWVEKKTIRHIHQWGEKIIVFEDVPAEVCRQCGEVYLSREVLDMIDQFILEAREPERTLTVPVFSLAGGST